MFGAGRFAWRIACRAGARVKILSGRWRRVALPLRAPVRTARTTLTSRDVLFVELAGADGVDGVAEGEAGTCASCAGEPGEACGPGGAGSPPGGREPGGAREAGGGRCPCADEPGGATGRSEPVGRSRPLRGYGEGVAFETGWYLPETLGEDAAILPSLLDALVGREIAEPRQADALLRAVPGAENLPMARAAVEPAVWDLFAQAAGLPLAEYLATLPRGGDSTPGAAGVPGKTQHGSRGPCLRQRGGGDGPLSRIGRKTTRWPAVPKSAAGGVVVPLGTQADTLAAVAAATNAGYERVKLKISEPRDLCALRAIRASHPKLEVIADANGAFAERDFARILDELDSIGLACIEEPIAREPGEPREAFYGRLAAAQLRMATPICLDESWTNAADLALALAHAELRCFAVKMAKLGGIGPTLDFLDLAAERGIAVWMGGMFDSGISKAAHAALACHPANAFAGDISDTARYFAEDPCLPPFVLEAGRLPLVRPGLGWTVRPEVFGVS